MRKSYDVCCPECGQGSWGIDCYDGYSICSNCGHKIDYIKSSDVFDEDIASEKYRENKWEKEW